MKLWIDSRRVQVAALMLGGLLAVASNSSAAEFAKSDGRPKVLGRKVANFVLPDASGKKVGLADFANRKIIVVVLMGTQCPINNLFVTELEKLHGKYAAKGVQVLGVNANLADSAQEVAKHVKEYKITFPVLKDASQQTLDLLGARRTPEVVVLDAGRRIRYRGRIDNRFGYTFKKKQAPRNDLLMAVDELLAGKLVSVPETEVMGCLITRREPITGAGKITYTKHIAKLIQRRCQNCHHPNTAAPFSLLTYDDVSERAAMLKEVVIQRRMPPWHADPRYGHFSNDLRMKQDEIDMLIGWINSGMPRGDKKDLPPAKQYADGWMIGKPDVVFKMPREFTVPASGTVKYQYFLSKSNFKEDQWVQAAEARPGNRAVVHHIILFYRPNKGAQNHPFRRVGIVGTAPGEEPLVLPADTGFRIPAGSDLIWELHYTPIGKLQKDRSSVGIVFCKKPPKHEVRPQIAINSFFRIPPGAGNHQVKASTRFRRDSLLLEMMPHMHLRGKDFLFRAIYPSGREETLLSVPSYDFNWQHTYRLAKPKRIPKGTVIECVAHFDNSTGNPANPAPDKQVRWGNQTWEEMMIGFMKYVEEKPE